LSQPMSTSGYLQSCFIQMQIPFGLISCSTPVCFSALAIVNEALIINKELKCRGYPLIFLNIYPICI
jgi:hypothetical protein